MYGSPPHTWGIQRLKDNEKLLFRITPTYMGNTDWFVIKQLQPEDHPHIHGEYQLIQTFGSPWPGITPTYMGNTVSGYQEDSVE